MKNLKLFLGLLAGAAVYCYLMWYQDLGLNALVFAILLITSLFIWKKELRNNKLIKWLSLSFLLSAASVVLTGIVFSKVIYYIHLLVFLAFVQMPSLRSLLFASGSFWVNSILGIGSNFSMVKNAIMYFFNKKGEKKNFSILRILMAGIILLVFFGIFVSANPQFRKLYNTMISLIPDCWDNLGLYFSNTIHYLFVFYFLSLFFFVFKENFVVKLEANFKDSFSRKRDLFAVDKGLTPRLSHECKTALLTISLVNALLLAVNLTDIFTVWLGIVPDTGAELSDFVHQGTYSLIFSTLLSIAILLFFFRNNLNLYSKNKGLKIVSYVWIVQNAVLLCSVALRNIHYVTQCGFTYKRIGVFIFLLITCIALIFLFLKIRNKKSFFYYQRTCGWGVLVTLLVAAFFNWDIIIASYNMTYTTDVDYHYLEELSKQTYVYCSGGDANEVYINDVKSRSWQSFNWGDYIAVKKLENNE